MLWFGSKCQEDFASVDLRGCLQVPLSQHVNFFKSLSLSVNVLPEHPSIRLRILTSFRCADDLSDDGVLYHYPSTNRPSGRDLAEIEATKAAGRLGLPVFVITYPSPGSARRDVHLGWVESWDDSLETFLITFSESQPVPPVTEPEEQPFRLAEERRTTRRQVDARVGQQRFKFRVFERYGLRCAVCGISAPQLLDAAHLRPKRERGSDDPRNGLVLCASHHRALDAGLFAIEPNSLRIRFAASGPDAASLRMDYPTLEHLTKKPHQEALEWLWSRWKR